MDQYLGFMNTGISRFWSDPKLKMIELTNPDIIPNDFQIRENTLLGKRAEVFFLKAISEQKHYEVLASQIQLIENGITLGELDYILKDTVSNQCYHVELSYKLYLFDSNASSGLKQWVGPNRRDSLHKKWSKLQNSQFPNIYTQAGIEIIKELKLQPEEIIQAVYMPLQLFLPYGKKVVVDAQFLPCVVGKWISFSAFQLKNWSGYEFFIPEKQDWFVNPEKCMEWFGRDEIITSLQSHIQGGSSRMVWIKLPNNMRQKIFVTFWE